MWIKKKSYLRIKSMYISSALSCSSKVANYQQCSDNVQDNTIIHANAALMFESFF